MLFRTVDAHECVSAGCPRGLGREWVGAMVGLLSDWAGDPVSAMHLNSCLWNLLDLKLTSWTTGRVQRAFDATDHILP